VWHLLNSYKVRAGGPVVGASIYYPTRRNLAGFSPGVDPPFVGALGALVEAAPPVTTTQTTVNSDGAFATAAGVSGTEITIQAGATLGALTTNASDLDIIFESGASCAGLSIGGYGSTAQRIRVRTANGAATRGLISAAGVALTNGAGMVAKTDFAILDMDIESTAGSAILFEPTRGVVVGCRIRALDYGLLGIHEDLLAAGNTFYTDNYARFRVSGSRIVCIDNWINGSHAGYDSVRLNTVAGAWVNGNALGTGVRLAHEVADVLSEAYVTENLLYSGADPGTFSCNGNVSTTFYTNNTHNTTGVTQTEADLFFVGAASGTVDVTPNDYNTDVAMPAAPSPGDPQAI
jgi:hypothetical protein